LRHPRRPRSRLFDHDAVADHAYDHDADYDHVNGTGLVDVIVDASG